MTTRHSAATETNENVTGSEPPALEPARDGESNMDFMLQSLGSLRESGRSARNAICLVGQRDLPGVVLRRAQAILRWDLRPSLWSHAFVIADDVELTPEGVAAAPIREVALHSRRGLFPDPSDNAVTPGRLGDYDDPLIDANIAVLAVEMNEEEAAKVGERVREDPNLDRLRYDLWATLGVWQSYFWSAGAAENPLRQSIPMFSSAFVEYCYEAIQFDLAPAASDRNSAPEHIWNGARWWHEELGEVGRPIHGRYLLRDKHCSLLDPKELKRARPEASGGEAAVG